MKSYSKFGLITAATLLSLVSLVSCTKTSTDVYTLTIWESTENQELIEELCDDFIEYYESKYPYLDGAITINFVAQEEGSAISNLETYASSGQGGDVIAFVNDTLLTGVENDLLDPLDKFTTVMESIVSEDAVEAFTVTADDGTSDMYAYPYAVETNVIIYLKDELSADDVSSWENLKAAGASVLFDLGDASDTNGGYYIKSLLTDSRIFRDTDGNQSNAFSDFVIVTDENVENLVYFYSNFKDNIENDIVGNAYTRFTSTTSLMHVNAVITTPYNYNVLSRNEALSGKLGVAALPTLNGKTLEPFNGYKAYGVNKYSQNPALAHELAYYLSTNISCLQARAENGVNPVLSDAYYSANNTSTAALRRTVDTNDCTSVVSEAMDYGYVMPSVSNFADYWAAMNKCASSLWDLTSYTTDSVKEILQTAQDTIRS